MHSTTVVREFHDGVERHCGTHLARLGVAETSPDNAHAGRAVEVREAPGHHRQHPQPRRSISGPGRTASTAHFPCRLL